MTELSQQRGTTPLEPSAAGQGHTGARPSNRTRFVLVGAGVIGKQHSQVMSQLADRIELVAAVDVHVDRAEKVAAEHGAATFPTW
jgi:threonine dehydrogenase-like Zn-dependent dehydrogenase